MMMSKSTNNIFYTKNLSLNNSLIFNNFSIQNVIISPNQYVNNFQAPIITNNYLIKSPIYSPSPKKYHHKGNIPQQIPKKTLFQKLTPLNSNKSAKKLNFNNFRYIQKPQLNNSTSYNSIFKTPEKHPLDSTKKKNNNKITQINIKNTQNILKTSASQKVFKSLKNPFSYSNISKNLNSNQINKNNFTEKKNNFQKYVNNNPEDHIKSEPKGYLNLNEFQMIEQIGKGSFGKIYCVKWKKNNKLYALKKEILNDVDTIQKRKDTIKIIQNFIKKTQSSGIINIYGNLILKNNMNLEYQYYELMEKAERDWDQEINVRSKYNLFYKESELLNIMNQLISTLVLMQKNHITHRDIKPQNILVINGKYKLCDLGEIRVLKRNGLIVQRIRGSELYMSPILFQGLHSNLTQVKHNTYKSDAFSLGMCFFYASSLTYNGVDSIRELTDMNKIKEILFKFLNKRYSEKYILLILLMLEIDEEKRPDFIELQKKYKESFKFQ